MLKSALNCRISYEILRHPKKLINLRMSKTKPSFITHKYRTRQRCGWKNSTMINERIPIDLVERIRKIFSVNQTFQAFFLMQFENLEKKSNYITFWISGKIIVRSEEQWNVLPRGIWNDYPSISEVDSRHKSIWIPEWISSREENCACSHLEWLMHIIRVDFCPEENWSVVCENSEYFFIISSWFLKKYFLNFVKDQFLCIKNVFTKNVIHLSKIL